MFCIIKLSHKSAHEVWEVHWLLALNRLLVKTVILTQKASEVNSPSKNHHLSWLAQKVIDDKSPSNNCNLVWLVQ